MSIISLESRLTKAMAKIKDRNTKPLILDGSSSEFEGMTTDELLIAKGYDPKDPMLPDLIIHICNPVIKCDSRYLI